jgi:glutathione S-transferase kappa 1
VLLIVTKYTEMAKKAVLELFFDVISPYSWIAFESLLRYEKLLPATLLLRPFSAGFVMKEAGNQPPAKVPRKSVNMLRDIKIVSNYWGFTINPPSNFEDTILKKGSLQAQRFLIALQRKHPDLMRSAARELWTRVWCMDKPIHEISNLREVCKQLNIADTEEIIANISSQEVKDVLKKNVEDANASGAFGAPWIILKQEGQADIPIFGSDRLPIICDLLGVDYKGPLRTNNGASKSHI